MLQVGKLESRSGAPLCQVVGVVVLMELAGLKGREKIAGYRLDSAICYPGK